MSLQCTDRIQIRIQPELKQAVKSFCDDVNVDLSDYIRGLIRRNLKKNGRIVTRKTAKQVYLDNVEDMPLKLEYEQEEWIRTV